MLQSKQKGELSEIFITAKLMELGYIVSKPIGDNQRYDLIVDYQNKLLKCQCKTGRVSDNRIIFNTASIRNNSKGYFINGYKDSCDLFLVCCLENKSFYKISVKECPDRECSLRLGNKIEDKRTNCWAIDYELK